MRVNAMLIGTMLAGFSVAACSGKHSDTGGNATAAAGTTSSASATPAMPRPGLWQMTVSAEGMPRPMTTQVCVGAPAPGVNPFSPPPQPGQACSKNSFTRTATGYTVAAECKMNGMTISSTGEVTGDFSSAYTVAMKTKMTGANIPAAMQAERTSTVAAKYIGACPSGMAPGTARQPS